MWHIWFRMREYTLHGGHNDINDWIGQPLRYIVLGLTMPSLRPVHRLRGAWRRLVQFSTSTTYYARRRLTLRSFIHSSRYAFYVCVMANNTDIKGKICWYLACVVQIHLCKRLIEMGDVVNEATCWGEINMLR